MGALKPDRGWNGFNVLHNAAARVGGLDLGFVPGKGGRDVDGILDGASAGEIEVVYLLGADEIDMERLGDAFVIYQGSHGDAGAHRADVILPGAAYTEKDAIYVNTEGRPQMTGRADLPAGRRARGLEDPPRVVRRARQDAALRHAAGSCAPQMFDAHPHLALLDQIDPADAAAIERLASKPAKPGKDRFAPAIADFYLTNPIARASAIMASLSALHKGAGDKATGTDG